MPRHRDGDGAPGAFRYVVIVRHSVHVSDDDVTPKSGRHHGRLDWQKQASTALFGAAGGMGINVLSNDVGYRGVAVVAVAAAVGAVFAASRWVRQVSVNAPRSPLAKHSPRILIGLAVLATIAAAFAPRFLTGPAVLAAAALSAAAALIANRLEAVSTVLHGVALIGGGVALIGLGVASLRRDVAPAGVAVIGLGLAPIGVGVWYLQQAGWTARLSAWLTALTREPDPPQAGGDPADAPDHP